MRVYVIRGAVATQDRQGDISLGDVTLDDNYTAGVIGGNRVEREAGTYVIAPGAYRIMLKNASLNETITVTYNNGTPEEVSPGTTWVREVEFNKVNKRQDFVGAVSYTVPAGGLALEEVSLPS